MKHDSTLWNAADAGGEGGAGRPGERLTERSARFVEKLMQKLARHNRDAEQLADAMRNKHRSA